MEETKTLKELEEDHKKLETELNNTNLSIRDAENQLLLLDQQVLGELKKLVGELTAAERDEIIKTYTEYEQKSSEAKERYYKYLMDGYYLSLTVIKSQNNYLVSIINHLNNDNKKLKEELNKL